MEFPLRRLAGGDSTPHYYSPPQLAKLLQVGRDKVLNWIRSGQLIAANVSDSLKPRYRVAQTDLELFLAGRMEAARPPRRRKLPTVEQFY